MDKKRTCQGQHHLITSLETKFGQLVKDVWSHKTAGTLKFFILRPMVEREKISTEDQQEYWLGVGMLLYLVKYLHPNVAIVTRELLKAKGGAIKYVFDTKNLGLKIQPTGNSNKPREIICFSDSNYAGDTVSMRRISGFITFWMYCVSWQSK